MKDLIQKFVEANGPSGYEAEIRRMICGEVEAFADEMRVDNLGNLIVRKGFKAEGGKRVMIAAHMDEIGVMVTHVDEKGFARFTNIGGVFPHGLVGSRVRFLNGNTGVIYLEQKAFSEKVPGLDKFFIDLGTENKQDCPIKTGDAAVFWRPFEDLGSRLVSKAMDDRIGVAILIQALKEIETTINELFFVFTSQEEVGLRGATTSAYKINPDIGLAVDITDSFDTPKDKEIDLALGNGPAIKVFDDYLVSDSRIVKWMGDTAKRINIQVQYEVLAAGGTDAGAIELTRAGVPSGCLSIPTRYAHSPSEIVDYDDVLDSVKLLVELLSNPIQLGEI